MNPAKYQCPSCSTQLRTKTALPSGKAIVCPKCQQRFVPKIAPTKSTNKPDNDFAAISREVSRTRTQDSETRPQHYRGPMLAVLLLFLFMSLVAVTTAGAWYFLVYANQDQIVAGNDGKKNDVVSKLEEPVKDAPDGPVGEKTPKSAPKETEPKNKDVPDPKTNPNTKNEPKKENPKEEPKTNPQPVKGWRVVRFADEDFQMAFPAAPMRTQAQINGLETQIFTAHNTNNDEYRVTVTKLSEADKSQTSSQILEKYSGALRKEASGETGLSLGKYSGLELQFGADKALTPRRHLFLIVDDRLFQLSNRPASTTSNTLDADRFFQSFTLLSQPKLSIQRTPVVKNDAPKHGPIDLLTYAVNGQSMVTATSLENKLWRMVLRNAKDGAIQQQFDPVSGPIIGMAISPNNQLLASLSGTPRKIQIWDLVSGKQLYEVGIRQPKIEIDTQTNFVFSADGKHLFAGIHGWICRLDVATRDLKILAHQWPEGSARIVNYCPMNDRLAVALHDPNNSRTGLHILDPNTEKKFQIGDQDNISALAFSADGKSLAVSITQQEKARLQIYDLRTWKIKSTALKPLIPGEILTYAPIFLSATGDGVAAFAKSGTYKGMIDFWDLSSLRHVDVWDGKSVTDAVVAPDGKTLVLADGTAKLQYIAIRLGKSVPQPGSTMELVRWSPAEPKPAEVMPKKDMPKDPPKNNLDGSWARYHGAEKSYSVLFPTMVPPHDGPKVSVTRRFIDNGTGIRYKVMERPLTAMPAATALENSAKQYQGLPDVQGKVMIDRPVMVAGKPGRELAIQLDNSQELQAKLFVIGRRWVAFETVRAAGAVPNDEKKFFESIEFAGNGNVPVVGGNPQPGGGAKQIRVRDARKMPINANGLALSKNGNYFLAYQGTNISAHSMTNGQALRSWREPGQILDAIITTKGGSVLMVVKGSKLAVVRDVASGKVVRQFNCLTPVHCADLSPDNRFVITGSGGPGKGNEPTDCVVRIWDVATSKVIKSLSDATEPILHVAFADNGTIVASTGKKVFRWQQESGELLSSFDLQRIDTAGPSDGFSLNGKYYHHAVPGGLALYDVVQGKLLRKYQGQTNAIVSIAISDDEQKILTCAENDNQLLVWDFASGTELVRAAGHLGPVRQAQFLSAPDAVISCSDDRTTHLWEITVRDLK